MIPFPGLYSKLIPSIPGSNAVLGGRQLLAEAAQGVYDCWDQGDDGLDEVYGAGGICDDIAEAMCEVLGRMGVQDLITHNSSIGENHTFVIASLADGIYSIDIPPSTYEFGGGYVWKKRRDVIIKADDILLEKLSEAMPSEEFSRLYSD